MWSQEAKPGLHLTAAVSLKVPVSTSTDNTWATGVAANGAKVQETYTYSTEI